MSMSPHPAIVVAICLGLSLALWAEAAYRLRQRAVSQRVVRLVRANSIAPDTEPARAKKRLTRLAEWVVGLFGEMVWPRQTSALQIMTQSMLAGVACGTALVALLGFPWWFGGITGMLMAGITLYLTIIAEQSRQAKQFEAMLADTIDMMVRMLRAGMPVTIAVERVGREAQEPAGTIYREVGQWLQVGLPLPQAMRNVAERIKIKDFDFFAAALAIQSTVGGNLTATLESLASVIRERILATLKARAVTAQARLTANIILVILPAIMVIMQLTQPGYLDPLIDGSEGYGLISFVLGSYFAALFTIRRMIARVKIV